MCDNTNPICPACKTKMIVYKYIGYYDSFEYWDCPECDDKPAAEDTIQGDYT